MIIDVQQGAGELDVRTASEVAVPTPSGSAPAATPAATPSATASAK
jgi:hypothetical protein